VISHAGVWPSKLAITIKEAGMMRFLLLGWIMAIPCGVVFGQDCNRKPVIAPPVAPPSVGYGAGVPANVPPSVPSCDRLEHLLKAAAHLEAAGLQEAAAKVWREAEQESKFVKQELESLRAEVARLRRTAGDPRRVLIHLTAIEAAGDKLRHLGVGWDGNLLTLHGGTVNVVNRGDVLFNALDALRKANLVKILAEPTLVTVSGRMVSFREGGAVPAPAVGDGKSIADLTTYGTEVNLLPTILGNGRLRIELHAKLSELDLRQTVDRRSMSVPGVTTREIETGVELQPGQTLALRGNVLHRATEKPEVNGKPAAQDGDKKANSKKASQDETEFCLLITAEILEGPDVPESPRR
jgi:hypothetical protein